MKIFDFKGSPVPWSLERVKAVTYTGQIKSGEQLVAKTNYGILKMYPEREQAEFNERAIAYVPELFTFAKEIYEAMWDKKHHGEGLSIHEESIFLQAETILAGICEE